MMIHNTQHNPVDTDFIKEIEGILDARHLSQHPFYQAWNAGTLTKEALQDYAKQYYPFVANFATYVSAVHSKTPYTDVRLRILANLLEEENPELLHEELWVQFAEGTGVDRNDLAHETDLLPETKAALAAFSRITSRSFIEGAAALLAYEAQISDIAELKMDGLKKFYGITDEKSLHFFEEHKVADIEHQKVWKWIIGKYADTEEKKEAVKTSLHEAMDGMWKLLDGSHRVHCA